jgi:type VI secretion system secreted protein Hcp
MAVDYFIKIGEVKGESKDKKYSDWIDVLSWSWGMSQSGSFGYGGGGGTGKVNIQDVSFMKRVDTASPDIMKHCAAGEHYPEATLIGRAAGGTQGGPVEYMKIVLTDVIITSVQHSASGGADERPMESISLNFAKVAATYTGQEQTGASGTSPDMKWDVTANAEF